MRAVALALGIAVAAVAPPAAGHHIGTYTARDNEVSANFKQLKFSIQARKFDVALRLYEDGALRKEMRARAARLPAGLEARARAALSAGDGPGAETALATFFAALARELAVEADARLADAATPVPARVAAGGKFLEAIWRYWSLIDFVVGQRDPKAAAAIRLAFEDAETAAKTASAPAALNPCSGPRPAGRASAPADPSRLRPPFQRIAQALGAVVETLSTSTRRDS